jgi:hypothetical protein
LEKEANYTQKNSTVWRIYSTTRQKNAVPWSLNSSERRRTLPFGTGTQPLGRRTTSSLEQDSSQSIITLFFSADVKSYPGKVVVKELNSQLSMGRLWSTRVLR